MVVALTLTLRYVPDEISRHGCKFLGRMYLRGRARINGMNSNSVPSEGHSKYFAPQNARVDKKQETVEILDTKVRATPTNCVN